MSASISTGLSPQQQEQYEATGYVLLPQLFNETEVETWRAECDRLLSLELVHPDNLRTGFRVLDGKPVIERYDPFVDISFVFSRLVHDSRLTRPLAALVNDRVNLFKDKLIFKLPGMSGYEMHQDASWWQGFPVEDLITAVVAIDGASATNGALTLFKGYHDRLLSTPGELRNMNPAEVAMVDPDDGEVIETSPGDVLIFHSLVPHYSGENLAQTSRRQLYLTYSAARHGDLYQAHRRHYETYSQTLKKPEEAARLYFR